MSKVEDIILVSGLPRSGTSMMMQMLQAGGIDIIIDEKRPADAHNPDGYFEFEKVKSLEQQNEWLGDHQGKAIKILFHLLKFLPVYLSYRIIFMLRSIDDVLVSQHKMLQDYGKPVQDKDKIKSIFENELRKTKEWLRNQKNMKVLFVNYNKTVRNNKEIVNSIENFLGCELDKQKMISVIKPFSFVSS